MKRVNLFTIQTLVPILFFLLFSCTEDIVDGGNKTDKGQTLALHLVTTISPIPETKAAIQSIHPNSKMDKAGFSYKLISTSTDNVAFYPETKAPSTLKNVYALLFTSTGAFNGRANIGTVTTGTNIEISFKDVSTVNATGCRLVIVANDNTATTSYSSTGGTGNFANFSGNYTAFQALAITNKVNSDADIPYAGSIIIDITSGEIGKTVSVPLYRTLAKITLKNTFNIASGPARNSITLYNAGTPYFATVGNNNYNGTGTTVTKTFVPVTDGGNDNNTTWYVGENIRPEGTNISTDTDRNSSNAPNNACYIQIASVAQSVSNTSPKIGEELNVGGIRQFTYDIFLGTGSDNKDFTIRRHTNYTIECNIGGTLVSQQILAATDGRVRHTYTGASGLVIGRFGGASGYSSGTSVSASSITGAYTRLLLLQPNTSGSWDNEFRPWGAQVGPYQTDVRKYWDRTYIYGLNIGGTIGGMSTTNSIYEYCRSLTIGGVPMGTWYVPTQAQLMAIWTLLPGLAGVLEYSDYSGIRATNYWSSTEDSKENARYVYFGNGVTNNNSRTTSDLVRCVRDL